MAESSMESQSQYPLFVLFTLSFISFSLLFFSLFFRRLRSVTSKDPQPQTSIFNLKLSLSKLSDKPLNAHFAQSVILELSGSNCDDPIESGSGSGRESEKKKKRKMKRKKKTVDLGEMGLKSKEKLVCLYPFTSSSSATQRKIKRQYDQLVRSHESKGLTLSQVGQFVNCLVDAKSELQHKSDSIKRKFTITKALLVKADRSSFERLRQQINKLELEQKRLEEDAFVYNWLQNQLKLSPAYKKIVEIGARMALKDKCDDTLEDMDTEQKYISFEEFLAKEKKDAFWQNYGKAKSCSA